MVVNPWVSDQHCWQTKRICDFVSILNGPDYLNKHRNGVGRTTAKSSIGYGNSG